jgi:hypothetical protein
MNTRPRAIALVAAALSLMAAAGLAACGTSPDHRHDLAQVTADSGGAVTVAEGEVTGRYLMEGGPINAVTGRTANPWPIDGQVIFSAAGHTASTAAGHDGEFSIRLAPGTYAVTARTPYLSGPGPSDSSCYLPQTVTVQAGAGATITVYCAVP